MAWVWIGGRRFVALGGERLEERGSEAEIVE
jgi:hypothetical protein